jgi:inosine-uridine nucleoside N-ribohydrolase
MRKFLIDTDTASDDAVALIMAHCWADVQVVAVTIVNGNVRVEQGVKNALYTLDVCNASTVDELGVLHKTPNMTVVWSINVQRWKEILYSCLRFRTPIY